MLVFSEKVKVKFRLAFPCGLLLIPQAPGPQDFRAESLQRDPRQICWRPGFWSLVEVEDVFCLFSSLENSHLCSYSYLRHWEVLESWMSLRLENYLTSSMENLHQKQDWLIQVRCYFQIFSQININEPLISSMKVFCWKNSIMKANRRISWV